ncbi:hypothetical protein BH10PSE17_BH10PSE17_30100 [soil metagenome]
MPDVPPETAAVPPVSGAVRIAKQSAAAVASLALLAAILYWLARKDMLDDIASQLHAARMDWFSVATVFMMAFLFAAGVRLHLLAATLRGAASRTGLLQSLAVLWLTVFVANGAPVGLISDIAKIAAIRSKLDLSLGNSLRVVIYDRLWGLLGICCLGLVSISFQATHVSDSVLIPQAVAYACALLGFVVLAALHRFRLFRKWQRLDELSLLVTGFFRSWRSVGMLVAQALIAVSSAALAGLVLYFLARAMSIDLQLSDALIFAPIILFSASIPIFYAGWGAREAVAIATLGTVPGVGVSGALAISICYGAAYLIASLPGAVVWAFNPTMFIRKR